MIALVLLAFAQRQVGIGWQLPHAPEADALIVGQARWLEARSEGASTDAQMAPHYPLLLGALVHAVPGKLGPPLPSSPSLEAALTAAAHPYVVARRVLAAMAALLVLATYLLARRYLPRWEALLAAALVATSLLHLDFSQQARPHVALATLCAFALVAQMRYLERGGRLALFGAALACGLAIACLHNGIFVLPAFVAALLLRARRDGSSPWRSLAATAPVWLLVPLISYASPFQLDADQRVAFSKGALDLSGHIVFLGSFDGSGLGRMLGALRLYDPVLLALAALGAAWAIPRAVRRGLSAPAAVALAYALPYAVLLALYARAEERFMTPLLPHLACLGALGARRLFELAAPALAPRARAAARVGMASILLVLPLWASLRLTLLRTRPDTAFLAAAWLAEHADRQRDVIHLSSALSIPLVQDRDAFGDDPEWLLSPWERYQLHLPLRILGDEPYRLRKLPAREALAAPSLPAGVLAAELLRNSTSEGAHWLVSRRLLQIEGGGGTAEAARAAGGEVVQAIDPYLPGRSRTPHDSRGRGLREVLLRRHLGPRLEIYQLPRPTSETAVR